MFSIPSIDDLRRALERYGIRASDLGRKAGVDKTIVSKIVNHRYNPSYGMMERLFGALEQLVREGSKSVSEVMVRDVVTVDINESLSSVISKMKRGGFSQVPVAAGGKFVGMVTERSLLMREEGATRVEDVLGSEYAVLGPDGPLESARRALLTCQAVAVVRNGSLAGILTKADLIR